MRTGTSHFVTRAAAIRYYEVFGYDTKDVEAKLAEGEIHIGPPTLKDGERLGMMDGGRYSIVTGSAC